MFTCNINFKIITIGISYNITSMYRKCPNATKVHFYKFELAIFESEIWRGQICPLFIKLFRQNSKGNKNRSPSPLSGPKIRKAYFEASYPKFLIYRPPLKSDFNTESG